MDYFKAALVCLPDDWKKEDYSNQIYVLVDLDKESVECKEIENLCNRNGITTITEINRIQHPFAYLRYQLAMEFERLWNNSGLVAYRKAVKVNDCDLHLYIRYNCDLRRLTGISGTNYVIQKHVDICPERDTNWYPEYVVKAAAVGPELYQGISPRTIRLI